MIVKNLHNYHFVNRRIKFSFTLLSFVFKTYQTVTNCHFVEKKKPLFSISKEEGRKNLNRLWLQRETKDQVSLL